MLDKVKEKIERYNELQELMASPEVTSNPEKLKTLGKEFNDLESSISMLREYVEAVENKTEAEELIKDGNDSDLTELAYEDLKKYEELIPELEEKIKVNLVPKDPADEKNAIVEIRAGTGGVEAGIFASDLYKMISSYAESKGWKIEVMNTSHGEMEALKEIIFMVKGEGAYGRLKFESGIHRVQRVPKTESQGRIHTSAASIAVLPEATDIEVDINQNDLRVDVYRSSGPGGQSVNTTDSAVRITHLPTNTVVTCQDEKSQHKNKAKALKVLRSRLYNEEKKRQHEKESASRKNMVGTGDRSAKIRTYNFPQERVTDHRINLTLHSLSEILQGNLDVLTDKLINEDIENKLNA